MKCKINDFLEGILNNCTSITLLLNRVFRVMLITLGVVTAISAVKEVRKEVGSCLDERIHAVLYILKEEIQEIEDISYYKVHKALEEYKIGNYGTTAILKVNNQEVKIEAIGSSNLTIDEIEKNINNQEDIHSYLKECDISKVFMKPDFKQEPLNLNQGLMNYKMRIGSTVLEDVYILSIAGPDEYLWKIIRIFINAILLTLICVPITLLITKKIFTIFSMQIGDLDKRIKELSLNKEDSFNEKYISSKNEIGKLAYSVQELAKGLERKSYIDELTQIGNKKKLYKHMNEMLSKGDVNGEVAIFFLDVDYFKRYNDNYGHMQGDNILKILGEILDKLSNFNEIECFRFGGEEFVVIADGYDKESSAFIAEYIQKELLNRKLEHKYSEVSKYISVSIGIYVTDYREINIEKMLKKADDALYMAKEVGRNRYIII